VKDENSFKSDSSTGKYERVEEPEGGLTRQRQANAVKGIKSGGDAVCGTEDSNLQAFTIDQGEIKTKKEGDFYANR
jgi:hypothetical protein